MKRRKPKSDTLITFTYLGIAGVLLLVALLTYPWITPPDIDAAVNKPLFDWEAISADNVASLEIIRYEAASDQVIDFRVEKNSKGLWTIPSSEGYPADAEEQVREAVTSFSGLTVIGVIPNKEDLFEEYGVLEPDRASLEAGQQGVGDMVTIKDRNGEILGSIVIGKSANVVDSTPQGASGNSPQNLRFVRKPGQPLVYVIDYDPNVLKTDFRDWIDKDVLDLNVIDIASVSFDDYQIIDPGNKLRQRFRGRVRSEGTRWKLEQFLEFDDPTSPTERTIGPNEELNNVRLNRMAETLGAFEVVDVARKPPGVNANLTVLGDESDQISLQSRGFVPFARSRDLVELKSMNGELRIDTKDGIRYVLRFGKNRPSDEGLEGSLDRYMMVSASVNEEMFPMPPEPVLPTEPTSGTDDEGAPAPPGGDAAPPPPGQEETEGDNKDDSAQSETDATQETSAGQDLDQERRRLQTEYRRQVQLRNEKLRTAEDRVAELNRRFGDWYYVISEESFKNLRVERDELIIKKGSLQGRGPLAPENN